MELMVVGVPTRRFFYDLRRTALLDARRWMRFSRRPWLGPEEAARWAGFALSAREDADRYRAAGGRMAFGPWEQEQERRAAEESAQRIF